MSFIKIIIFLFVAFTFQIGNSLVVAEQNGPETLPPCKGEGCFAVAKPAPWPAPSVRGGVKVKYKYLSLTLPKNIESIGIGDTVAAFNYGKDQRILIGSLANDDFERPESDISLTEDFEIMYTKTPKDKEPEDKNNKFAWRIIMLTKQEIFENKPQIWVYRKDDLSVYFVSDSKGPYSNTAHIINSKVKDSLVTIQSNIDSKSFVDILASIKPKEK